MKKFTLFTFAVLLSFCIYAQDESKESADDVAAKLNNPTAVIGSMNFLTDFKTFSGDLPGADEQTSWSLTFQPSMPKPLGESGYNLLFRPAIPIIFSQPVYGTDGFNSSGFQFGNIGFDLAVGTTSAKGIMVLAGLAGTLPTASSSDIKAQWAFGPEFMFGYLTKKIILGVLVSQQWDVESGPMKTNILGGQYFIYKPIGKGRSIGAAPLYSYNWETKDLTLPLGIGYSAVTTMGANPFKYGLYVFYHVASPDPIGQIWQVRLQLTPVVKLPW